MLDRIFHDMSPYIYARMLVFRKMISLCYQNALQAKEHLMLSEMKLEKKPVQCTVLFALCYVRLSTICPCIVINKTPTAMFDKRYLLIHNCPFSIQFLSLSLPSLSVVSWLSLLIMKGWPVCYFLISASFAWNMATAISVVLFYSVSQINVVIL